MAAQSGCQQIHHSSFVIRIFNMLSRVANSLYWMARYIERAENIARIVDVNLQLLLDIRNLDEMVASELPGMSIRPKHHWRPVEEKSLISGI